MAELVKTISSLHSVDMCSCVTIVFARESLRHISVTSLRCQNRKQYTTHLVSSHSYQFITANK